MRLLILTPEFEGRGGGIMTFYQALAPALQTLGVELRIIEGSAYNTAVDRSVRRLNCAFVETLELDRMRRWHTRFGHLASTPGLRCHLAAAWAMWEQAAFGEDADIVEACDWGLLFAPPALDATRPLVVQCHGSVGQIAKYDPLAGEEMQGVLARLIEGAIFAGAGTVQTYSCANAAYWRDITARAVDVIRPAWAYPAVPPQPVNDRGLVVARVQCWKGPDILCAAVERLSGRVPQIDWIGRDTPFEERGKSTASYLARTYPGTWGKKIVHGLTQSPDQIYRRQAASLFNVVPSTWDVFNFTVVEAMASGRPAVVSTGAGASELIEDGVNGYLFSSGDSEHLAATIERLLNDSPAHLAEVGRAAQETVRRTLAPETIAAQRFQAYCSTLETFRANRVAHLCKPIQELCRAAEECSLDDSSFLHQFPFRTLVRHVGERVARKAALRGASNV